MKKIIPVYGFLLCSALLLQLIPSQAIAQNDERPVKKFQFGVGVEGGKLLGDPGKNYKNGLGGNLTVSYAIQEEARITLSGGYLFFGGKDYEDEYLAYSIDDWKAVPLRLGGKYFVSPNFFLKAETGAVFFLEPGSGTSLILSPGAGLRYGGFELAAKIETWTDGGTVSHVGLNLNYFF